MSSEEAAALAKLLDLPENVRQVLVECPMRGSLEQVPPTDPMIYRFYEIIQVYGTTMKAIINEKFGDGIMSAIDFTMGIEKVPNPAATGYVSPWKAYSFLLRSGENFW